MSTTKINYVDKVWNPVIGCARGCPWCYAGRFASRLAVNPKTPEYAGLAKDGRWTGEVRFLAERLSLPLRWRKPAWVMVESMGDMFSPGVTDEQVAAVFGVMAGAPRHTFVLLTKFPERAAKWFQMATIRSSVMAARSHGVEVGWPLYRDHGQLAAQSLPWPLPNVILGTSVTNPPEANERIPWLLRCPAALRAVSVEPMLGAVELDREWLAPFHETDPMLNRTPRIDWVICGGESGPHARPMHPDWVRGLRDQCVSAGVPFTFKAWGAYGSTAVNLRTRKAAFRFFNDFDEWVNKAQTWMSRGDTCVDMAGRIVTCGGDMMLARDDEAFPVAIVRRRGDAGRELDGQVWDQRPKVVR